MVCRHGDTTRKSTGRVSVYQLPAITTTGEKKNNNLEYIRQPYYRFYLLIAKKKGKANIHYRAHML